MPKNALFLLKNRKSYRALGAPPPDPLLPAYGGFAPSPLASGVLRLPPDPYWPSMAGGSASRPSQKLPFPSMTNFWLHAWH